MRLYPDIPSTRANAIHRDVLVLLVLVLLAEAFGGEIVFERPPAFVQKALARTVAPLVRARGRSVTGDDVVRAAIVDPARWPDPGT